jgi:hypothetical protein
MTTLKDELAELIEPPGDTRNAVALMAILCGCKISLPSGRTINGPSDEPMGREAAAELVGALMNLHDHIELKTAFNVRGDFATAEEGELDRNRWRQALEEAGLAVEDW